MLNEIDAGIQAEPSLAKKGDELERGYWGNLSKLIPHYELFWRYHVFPLRVPNQIWLRDQLDPQFEAVAITNYSAFVSIGRARQKVFINHENYKFVEEHYAALQRCCELGIKLIQRFDDLYESVTRQQSGVSESKLEQFIDARLDQYRNLLHDEMISTPKGERRRRLIPKFDKIDAYRQWSTVMYHLDRSDFVVVADQLKDDFRSTCCHLEDAWKEMCRASQAILNHKEYLRRRDAGIAIASVGNPLAASGAIIVRSTFN
ncbi:MAG TPA: hypothetical protein VFO39_07130 [Candidatus Sulfotelmatobacter sp.]|nr:hypothetical protein [Candidatus Sulfotelmatobacter sp.]